MTSSDSNIPTGRSLSRRKSGCLRACTLRHSAAPFPPGLACGMRTAAASAETNSLRVLAFAFVVFDTSLPNGDSSRSRPASSADCHAGASRTRPGDFAGQMMTGCLPAKRKSRHSRSMGEWKPPATTISASRNDRMASNARRTTFPGHCTEQISPRHFACRMSRLPTP